MVEFDVISQASRFEAFLKWTGLTQREFAEQFGSYQSTISQIIAGKRSVPQKLLKDIALRYQEVNIKWIEMGEGQMIKPGSLTLQEPGVEYLGHAARSLTLVEVQDKLLALERELKNALDRIEAMEIILKP